MTWNIRPFLTSLDLSQACSPGQRADEGASVLGGADGISAGRVHDDDAFPRGGFDVHIVNAGASATHDLQPGSGVDDLLRGAWT